MQLTHSTNSKKSGLSGTSGFSSISDDECSQKEFGVYKEKRNYQKPVSIITDNSGSQRKSLDSLGTPDVSGVSTSKHRKTSSLLSSECTTPSKPFKNRALRALAPYHSFFSVDMTPEDLNSGRKLRKSTTSPYRVSSSSEGSTSEKSLKLALFPKSIKTKMEMKIDRLMKITRASNRNSLTKKSLVNASSKHISRENVTGRGFSSREEQVLHVSSSRSRAPTVESNVSPDDKRTRRPSSTRKKRKSNPASERVGIIEETPMRKIPKAKRASSSVDRPTEEIVEFSTSESVQLESLPRDTSFSTKNTCSGRNTPFVVNEGSTMTEETAISSVTDTVLDVSSSEVSSVSSVETSPMEANSQQREKRPRSLSPTSSRGNLEDVEDSPIMQKKRRSGKKKQNHVTKPGASSSPSVASSTLDINPDKDNDDKISEIERDIERKAGIKEVLIKMTNEMYKMNVFLKTCEATKANELRIRDSRYEAKIRELNLNNENVLKEMHRASTSNLSESRRETEKLISEIELLKTKDRASTSNLSESRRETEKLISDIELLKKRHQDEIELLKKRHQDEIELLRTRELRSKEDYRIRKQTRKNAKTKKKPGTSNSRYAHFFL